MVDQDVQLKLFLEEKYQCYNQPSFIPLDPISIPHGYAKKQDIEITGFIAAMLAWGQRPTIINKCKDLFMRMDGAPYEFVIHHRECDLKRLLGFKHRTFNEVDVLYFVEFFRWFYQQNDSLEEAFVGGGTESMEMMLIYFHKLFFSLSDAPHRTQKHVATPARKSTCKRLNMFLRWMVRKDNQGVDFGLWNRIKPHQLICPCDLHVDRVARRLKLIKRKQTDWQTALELTSRLKQFDAEDPVKYDFALFGLGVMEHF